jgi:ABC-type branched-subunit amino acid transport system substrate-binding protein
MWRLAAGLRERKRGRRAALAALLAGMSMCVPVPTAVAERYQAAGSDTEIRIGQTMPYSGPVSSLGTIGRAQLAYFEKVNAEGGVRGRKLTLISVDDAYSPPKTVEQVRKLVEQDQVLFLFASVGTPTNSAIHKYVNAKKVPHLLISAGASKWGDPKRFPWTTPFPPPASYEGRVLANHILSVAPKAKIGVLYQNDDFGKDGLRGLKEALGERAATMIVSEQSYEVSDPTVDQQIISLKAAGADVLFDVGMPKFVVQAIRKTNDMGWKPMHLVFSPASSLESVLKPAGLEKSVGLISVNYIKDPSDRQWADTPAVKDYLAFMHKYYPQGDPSDVLNVVAYSEAQALIYLLERCGDELTRTHLLRQATSISNLQLPMLLPGVKINTSATDYFAIEQMQLMRFDGKRWVRFGEVTGG